MERTLSEDIIYPLLYQAYYDEEVALPDYSTLSSLCLVNHAVSRPAQRLLFRWVRLLSLRGINSFTNACRGKPWLGRGAYILHVRLGRGSYPHGNQSVKAPDLVLALSAVPKLRTLMLDIDLPIDTMENRVLAPFAALPAARTISSLHLKAPTNAVMHPLIDALPAVTSLELDFHRLDRMFPPLPANRSFVEVSISFETGTPPYACAAFFAPQWKVPLEVFSLRYGVGFNMLLGHPTPAATLRSLRVDHWDENVAALAASCSQLVELILWEPSLGDLAAPFADTFPTTLEHFAFPGDLIEFNRGYRALTGVEFTALSQLPSRLNRLRYVSMYNSNQSSWAVLLGVNCASAGITVRRYGSVGMFIKSSFSLNRTVFPRSFDVCEFAQLQDEDGGLNNDPIDELVIGDRTFLTRLRRKWRTFSSSRM